VTGTNEYGESFDNNWNIEDYLQHVYEIPASWNSEALKAQAVAARSYALSYTGNGSREICPSQHCQVVKQTPHDNPCDGWCQAVKDTSGVVMTSGGNPISAYFSSTAGGYIYSSSSSIGSQPWTKDAQDGSGSYNNFNDVRGNAYDRESPWFYCDWGSRSAYGGTAWLKSEELADIVNVILIVQKDQSTIANVYQVDASNPAGKETWNEGRVKDELRNRGGSPFNSISSVNISADFGSGKTMREPKLFQGLTLRHILINELLEIFKSLDRYLMSKENDSFYCVLSIIKILGNMKYMKKLLSFFVFLLVFLIFSQQAHAVTFDLIAPTEQLSSGQDVRFTINIDTEGHSLTSTQIGMSYDTTVLQYVSISPGNSFTTVTADPQTGGKMIVTGSSTSGYSGAGSFAVVTFNIIAQSPGSTQLCALYNPANPTPTSAVVPTNLPITGSSSGSGRWVVFGVIMIMGAIASLTYFKKA
jgi:SpoIID/LytB domain protein